MQQYKQYIRLWFITRAGNACRHFPLPSSTHDQVLYWMLTHALLTVVVVMTLLFFTMSMTPELPAPIVAPEFRVATTR
jgi:hypothetical protein